MNIPFKKIKEIDWVLFFKRNKYSFISICILALYSYATLSAVFFIATRVRRAFSIDEKNVEHQLVTFDLEGYRTIVHRFGQEIKK